MHITPGPSAAPELDHTSLSSVVKPSPLKPLCGSFQVTTPLTHTARGSDVQGNCAARSSYCLGRYCSRSHSVLKPDSCSLHVLSSISSQPACHELPLCSGWRCSQSQTRAASVSGSCS